MNECELWFVICSDAFSSSPPATTSTRLRLSYILLGFSTFILKKMLKL